MRVGSVVASPISHHSRGPVGAICPLCCAWGALGHSLCVPECRQAPAAAALRGDGEKCFCQNPVGAAPVSMWPWGLLAPAACTAPALGQRGPSIPPRGSHLSPDTPATPSPAVPGHIWPQPLLLACPSSSQPPLEVTKRGGSMTGRVAPAAGVLLSHRDWGQRLLLPYFPAWQRLISPLSSQRLEASN